MFEHTSLLLVAIIVCSAAFLQGFSGFGINLFAVGILAHLADVHTVVPLCIFLALINTWFLLWQNRRFLKPRPLLPLLTAAVAGAPLGVAALSRLDSTSAMQVLGVTLIAIALAQWFTNRSFVGEPKPWKAGIAGLLGGLLGGAFGTAGPPIVVYIHQTHEPQEARTALYTIFGVISIITLSGHILSGNATQATFRTGLLLLPTVLLGGALGGLTASRIKPALFRQGVTLLLGLLGLSLLFR